MARSFLYLTLVLASAVIMGHGNVLNPQIPADQIVVSADTDSPDNCGLGTADDYALFQHIFLTVTDKYLSAETTFRLTSSLTDKNYSIRAPPPHMS